MAKKVVSVKFLAVMMSAVLVLGGVIGGTFAWLIDETEEVVNTFTYGDINIELNETTGDEYEMLPGREIEKDPVVTVKAGSENSWVFVQLTKSDNYDKFMNGYTMAEGWTPLYEEYDSKAVEGVFYRFYGEDDQNDALYPVLADNKVVVKAEVTKKMLNELDDEDGENAYPTLTVKAYAIQYEGFEPVLVDNPTVGATAMEQNDAVYKAWEAILSQPAEEEEETPAP